MQVNIQYFYHRTIRTYMIDDTVTGTPTQFAAVAERYESLTSDHVCGRHYLGWLPKHIKHETNMYIWSKV